MSKIAACKSTCTTSVVLFLLLFFSGAAVAVDNFLTSDVEDDGDHYILCNKSNEGRVVFNGSIAVDILVVDSCTIGSLKIQRDSAVDCPRKVLIRRSTIRSSLLVEFCSSSKPRDSSVTRMFEITDSSIATVVVKGELPQRVVMRNSVFSSGIDHSFMFESYVQGFVPVASLRAAREPSRSIAVVRRLQEQYFFIADPHRSNKTENATAVSAKEQQQGGLSEALRASEGTIFFSYLWLIESCTFHKKMFRATMQLDGFNFTISNTSLKGEGSLTIMSNSSLLSIVGRSTFDGQDLNVLVTGSSFVEVVDSSGKAIVIEFRGAVANAVPPNGVSVADGLTLLIHNSSIHQVTTHNVNVLIAVIYRLTAARLASSGCVFGAGIFLKHVTCQQDVHLKDTRSCTPCIFGANSSLSVPQRSTVGNGAIQHIFEDIKASIMMFHSFDRAKPPSTAANDPVSLQFDEMQLQRLWVLIQPPAFGWNIEVTNTVAAELLVQSLQESTPVGARLLLFRCEFSIFSLQDIVFGLDESSVRHHNEAIEVNDSQQSYITTLRVVDCHYKRPAHSKSPFPTLIFKQQTAMLIANSSVPLLLVVCSFDGALLSVQNVTTTHPLASLSVVSFNGGNVTSSRIELYGVKTNHVEVKKLQMMTRVDFVVRHTQLSGIFHVHDVCKDCSFLLSHVLVASITVDLGGVEASTLCLEHATISPDRSVWGVLVQLREDTHTVNLHLRDVHHHHAQRSVLTINAPPVTRGVNITLDNVIHQKPANIASEPALTLVTGGSRTLDITGSWYMFIKNCTFSQFYLHRLASNVPVFWTILDTRITTGGGISFEAVNMRNLTACFINLDLRIDTRDDDSGQEAKGIFIGTHPLTNSDTTRYSSLDNSVLYFQHIAIQRSPTMAYKHAPFTFEAAASSSSFTSTAFIIKDTSFPKQKRQQFIKWEKLNESNTLLLENVSFPSTSANTQGIIFLWCDNTETTNVIANTSLSGTPPLLEVQPYRNGMPSCVHHQPFTEAEVARTSTIHDACLAQPTSPHAVHEFTPCTTIDPWSLLTVQHNSSIIATPSNSPTSPLSFTTSPSIAPVQVSKTFTRSQYYRPLPTTTITRTTQQEATYTRSQSATVQFSVSSTIIATPPRSTIPTSSPLTLAPAMPQTPPPPDPVAPPPVKQLPKATRVTTQTTTGTVTAASVAASTTAAADLQGVMVTMQAVGQCGGDETAGGVGEAGNTALVPFTIGSSATRGIYALLTLSGGGVALNLVLVALARAFKRDNREPLAAGRFPSVAIRLFEYTYQGLAIEVVRVLADRKFELDDDDSGVDNSGGLSAYRRVAVEASDRAVAVAVLFVVCVALPVGLSLVVQHPQLAAKLEAEFHAFRHVFERKPRLLRALFLPLGFWTSPVKRELGALFTSFSDATGFRWYLFPYARALLIAAAVVAVDDCTGKLVGLAAVVALGIAFKVYFRLQRLRFTLTLSAVNDVILLLLIATSSAGGGGEGQVATGLGLAAVGLSVVGALVTAVLKLRVEKRWVRQERQLAAEEDTQAAVPMLDLVDRANSVVEDVDDQEKRSESTSSDESFEGVEDDEEGDIVCVNNNNPLNEP